MHGVRRSRGRDQIVYLEINFKNVKAALKEWSTVRFGALDNGIETHRKNAMKWELEAKSCDLEESEVSEWLEVETDIKQKQKRTKNKAKNDKTGHGIE
ncbi:hypothetical protein Tco_0346278 [Tanacetum coccineum]